MKLVRVKNWITNICSGHKTYIPFPFLQINDTHIVTSNPFLNAIVFWRLNRTERYNIKGVYDKCNYNCVMYVKNVKPIFPYMQKMNTCHVQTQNTYLQLYIPLFLYIYHASSKKIKFNIVKNIENRQHRENIQHVNILKCFLSRSITWTLLLIPEARWLP